MRRHVTGLRLFWQLLIAFVITASVIALGIYVSGIVAFRRVELELADHVPTLAELWSRRLASYYDQENSWSGVDAMIASYPVGEDWAPWDDAWELDVAVFDADGGLVFSTYGDKTGATLTPADTRWAVPIERGDEVIGYLAMPWLRPPPPDGPSEMPGIRLIGRPRLEFLQRALRRLVLTEAIVVLLGLVVGAVLSRRISRPVGRVAEAAGHIAAGDLGARVEVTAPGELGDLARSFNQMATALQRSDELRRNMTADVAHDLRTPLSVIRGKLEGILDGVYPATEAHILPVLEETEVLTQLVEDLRLLALAEARQLQLERRPVDIGGLLRDAQVNFTPLAQDRGITVVLDLERGVPRVLADRQRISQVLGNLITNALRHTPAGGIVTLSAAAGDDWLTVAISDTGVGIPPDDMPYVFERFWRGEKSRSRESGGSGLGLAIAKELVALQGGTIAAESEPGKGATFRFALPLTGATDGAEVAA